MPDVHSKAVRSFNMSRIRGVDTKPELLLRRGLHARGLRYRLHVRTLPGTPDMVFPSKRAVLFVHGCFWHGHECHLFRWPASRQEFWRTKIDRNRAVDAQAQAALAADGWRYGVVWECALKGKLRPPLEEVLDRCVSWIRSDHLRLEIQGCTS